MKSLVFLFGVLAICNGMPSALDDWTAFKAKHGKSYSSANEENFRLGVYLSNKQMIDDHNAKYEAGLESYKLKINHFGDMLQEEISAQVNGFNSSVLLANTNELLTFTRKNTRLPSEVDWREKGAVTPVKDQGRCGACWAFSTTGSLEGQMFLKLAKRVTLSEQNLVDCSEEYGNEGCNGGVMWDAVRYIADNGGIDSEESYPYEGEDGQCRFRKSGVAATARNYVGIQAGDEEALKEAVANVGPISVAINAGLQSFSYYGGGVYNDRRCNQNLNHAVLLVGYGTQNGQDYWLVKNSWNTHWGEDGYVKIARNKGNLCGIASSAGYPKIF